MNERTFECCLCHQMTIGYGNDPWPLCSEKLAGEEDVKCCDECNMRFVIPARLRAMLKESAGIYSNENIRDTFEVD